MGPIHGSENTAADFPQNEAVVVCCKRSSGLPDAYLPGNVRRGAIARSSP